MFSSVWTDLGLPLPALRSEADPPPRVDTSANSLHGGKAPPFSGYAETIAFAPSFRSSIVCLLMKLFPSL